MVGFSWMNFWVRLTGVCIQSIQFRYSDWRAGVMDRGYEREGGGGVLTPAGIIQDL
jgi:hypothetical protein